MDVVPVFQMMELRPTQRISGTCSRSRSRAKSGGRAGTPAWGGSLLLWRWFRYPAKPMRAQPTRVPSLPTCTHIHTCTAMTPCEAQGQWGLLWWSREAGGHSPGAAPEPSFPVPVSPCCLLHRVCEPLDACLIHLFSV